MFKTEKLRELYENCCSTDYTFSVDRKMGYESWLRSLSQIATLLYGFGEKGIIESLSDSDDDDEARMITDSSPLEKLLHEHICTSHALREAVTVYDQQESQPFQVFQDSFAHAYGTSLFKWMGNPVYKKKNQQGATKDENEEEEVLKRLSRPRMFSLLRVQIIGNPLLDSVFDPVKAEQEDMELGLRRKHRWNTIFNPFNVGERDADDEYEEMKHNALIDRFKIAEKMNALAEDKKRIAKKNNKNQKIKEKQDAKRAKRIKANFRMPGWEEVVEVMVTSLETTSATSTASTINLTLSRSNIFAFVDMTWEFINIVSVAFSPSVPWGFPELQSGLSSLSQLAFPDVPNSFQTSFYTCAVLGLLYPLLAIPGMQAAQKGTLGSSKDGQKMKFFSWDFWFLMTLKIFGSSLFYPIVLNCLRAFVCTKKDGNGEEYFVTGWMEESGTGNFGKECMPCPTNLFEKDKYCELCEKCYGKSRFLAACQPLNSFLACNFRGRKSHLDDGHWPRCSGLVLSYGELSVSQHAVRR